MAPNYYLYEKVFEMRRLDLQREVEQRRLLARLPKQRRNRGKRAVHGLGVFLIKLGMWLKQSAEQREPARDHA